MNHIIHLNKTPAIIAGVLFFLSLGLTAKAQDAVIQSDFEHKINLYNVNGKPLTNGDIDVAGNPYFQTAWRYGLVQIKGSAPFDNIPMRLDLQSQQLHFKNSKNEEIVIMAGAVREVSLYDSSTALRRVYTFRSGFPAIDNQNENNFYMVLSDGKLQMLKSMRKQINVDHDQLSGETRKEFRLYEDYYFFSQGQIQRIKKDKSFVLALMGDKQVQVNQFLSTNKVSFKSMDDINKLVEYYNSLK